MTGTSAQAATGLSARVPVHAGTRTAVAEHDGVSYYVILVVPLVALATMTLFAAPAARLAPRHVPIAVAGTSPASEEVLHRLGLTERGFDVHRVPDEAAATRAIEEREVYGAVVSTPSGTKVLVATAASPVVAQLLTAETAGFGRVVDVVPASHASAAIGACVLPLVLAGIVTGVLSGTVVRSGLRRGAFVIAGSTLAALAATVILQNWLGAVHGDWLGVSGGLGLTVLSVAAFVAGMDSWLGRAGVAAGALTMILVGNPFSAVNSAPELLPRPTGTIGQLMPPGAGANLLRSEGLFGGAGAGGHVIALAGWVLGGLLLLALASTRQRHRQRLAS